ncbi:MAG: hypothetical protein KJ955_06930 [Nanoarchaeota archaeon]|nr:hypothetical protein [Nanoarchaeota archaeon]
MIQLGTPGNFFHAIWMKKVGDALKLENECFVGKDNVIAVGKDLRADLAKIVALHPDIVVAGTNGCRVNCSECCDTPAYRNRVERRYCEYLTEVGNYCIPKLAGEKADEVCKKWFCVDFCEDPADRYSGSPLEVPRIHNPERFYTPEQKREFLFIATALQTGTELKQIPLFGARGREVMLYKAAKKGLLKIADKEAAALIHSDKFDDAEELMGSNPYFEMLREWEEVYCRRKGIRKEE